MSVPTVRGTGAFGSGTTSCTAAVPTGGSAPVSGDAMYIVVESTDSSTAAGTPNTPGGWTKLYEQTVGGGASDVTTLTVFGKIAGVGEADVTIDGVGDHCAAAMVVIAGHGLATINSTVVGAQSNHGTTTAGCSTSGITVTGNSLIIQAIGYSDDANDTTNGSNYVNANLASITERIDQTVNTGAGGGVGIVTATCAGTSTGATVWDHDTAANCQSVHLGVPPLPTAAITGTITSSVNEADVVAGGKTLVITLTDDSWIPAGAGSFDLQRDEILAGIDSAQSEATGWDAVPKVNQALGGIVRTSGTVVTITWDAFATYNITAQETITVTIPGTAVVSGKSTVATPTFTVSPTGGSGPLVDGKLVGGQLTKGRLVRGS